MSAFVDSSALVKLYVPERQHQEVRTLPDPMVIASIAKVEVIAAFWRKQRLGDLDAGDAALLSAAFVADLDDPEGPFAIVSLTGAVLEHAASCVARHPLRAYDAVQLGTALAARDAVETLDTFAAFDVALRRAASIEGFTVLPHKIAR